MTVVVTGATGFVGRGVRARLAAEGTPVRAVVRSAAQSPDEVAVGHIDGGTRWVDALAGATAVVHLAARVHVMRDTVTDPLAEFRRTNVDGTVALAEQAARTGVRRFVFVSSIKVNGEAGTYRETDRPAPVDPYGISKLEAEERLRGIERASGMEVTIVRPPLVYGPGVKGNFRALMRLIERGLPLPFGGIRNKRSLVALDNLSDFIAVCVAHPAAARETFFVSDGEDVSTPDLARRLARAMGRPARLIPVPGAFIQAGATLLGRRNVARRLVGSLQLDIGKARTMLGWVPPLTLEEGLRRAANNPTR
jgi:nucleoside-diphosphate-sugar epimerase